MKKGDKIWVPTFNYYEWDIQEGIIVLIENGKVYWKPDSMTVKWPYDWPLVEYMDDVYPTKDDAYDALCTHMEKMIKNIQEEKDRVFNSWQKGIYIYD